MDEAEAKFLRKKQLVADNAMPILVHKLGGDITITQDDFDEMSKAYGGYEKLAVAAEMKDGVLRLRLVRKPSTIA